MHHQILDREGRQYRLTVSEQDAVFLIQLYDRHTLIGEARCIRESPETFYLGDIAIANDVIASPANWWDSLLRKIPGYQPQSVSYRGKGLGSTLLQALIEQARTAGGQTLYGTVFRQDCENNPNLLQWYQKHGFEIQPPHPEDEDMLALIHLNLNQLKL